MTIIIDPTSPEVNRGSFCYTPYLLYSALADEQGVKNVCLIEDFSIASHFDGLREFKNAEILCALWSYPQIETCVAMHMFAKELGMSIRFFGYEPLIYRLGLPIYEINRNQLLKGMSRYMGHILSGQFKHILLSDCDMHLSDAKGYVVPFFTSYGCPRGCKFCSASLNTNYKRYELDFPAIRANLKFMSQNNVDGIHFTDEDFFFNTERAVQILQMVWEINPRLRIIALGHIDTFHKFLKAVEGSYDLQRQMQVLKLVEIGLETADRNTAKNELGKRGTVSAGIYEQVATNPICKVLWLTMTFYPGDNISSINTTGSFLRKYGLAPDDLDPRIRTNGTEAGLGQFYQFYDGCIGMNELRAMGTILTERPMRLLPSFMPDSFLNDFVYVDKEMISWRMKDYLYWCKVNKCSEQAGFVLGMVQSGKTVQQIIGDPTKQAYTTFAGKAVALAVMARLSMITGGA